MGNGSVPVSAIAAVRDVIDDMEYILYKVVMSEPAMVVRLPPCSSVMITPDGVGALTLDC